MRIKKVQFKNGYKRFFDLTIDLGDFPQRIIALVGPNGCGKRKNHLLIQKPI